ncbi:MAG TPA: hypothetical protein VF485_11905 [Sphingomonas sp.]
MIRRRDWAVILGTATALLFCFVNPLLGQPMRISMALWRKLLEYLHRRGTLKTV